MRGVAYRFEPCMVRKIEPNGVSTTLSSTAIDVPRSPGAHVDPALVRTDPHVPHLRDQYRRSLCRLHGARAHPARVASGRRGRGVSHRRAARAVLCHLRDSDLLAGRPGEPAQHPRDLSDHLVRRSRSLCGLLAQLSGVPARARSASGVGEAGGTPPSTAIVSDYFPADRRPMAMTVLALGAPIGAWLGANFAGAVAHRLHLARRFHRARHPGSGRRRHRLFDGARAGARPSRRRSSTRSSHRCGSRCNSCGNRKRPFTW